MEKTNVKIKSNITIADEIFAIENIVEYYFTDNEYTPYYAELGKITAVARNFLDGVEFNLEDDVYQLVMENDDIYKCVKKFIYPSASKLDADYFTRMERIMKQVGDIVEFRKQKLIHNSDAFSIVGEMCQVIVDTLSNFANLNIQALTPENIEMAKEFMSAIKDENITEETLAAATRKAADQFKFSSNDVIEGQRQRIAEQQEQLREKETEIQDLRKWKRDHESRNVKADKRTEKIIQPVEDKK